MSNFRPAIECLEARENPATPGDVFAAASFAESNADLLDFIRANPGYVSNADLQPLGQTVTTVIAVRSTTDAPVLFEFVSGLRAQIAADPALAPGLQPSLDRATALLAQTQANLQSSLVFFDFIVALNPDLTPDLSAVDANAIAGSTAPGTSTVDPSLIDSSTLFNPDGTINQDAIDQATAADTGTDLTGVGTTVGTTGGTTTTGTGTSVLGPADGIPTV